MSFHPSEYGIAVIGKEDLEIPVGFVAVSKEEFYEAIGPLNVHPRAIPPSYRSDWHMLDGTNEMVGRSSSGFDWYRGKEKAYCLIERLAVRVVTR